MPLYVPPPWRRAILFTDGFGSFCGAGIGSTNSLEQRRIVLAIIETRSKAINHRMELITPVTPDTAPVA
jgi:hypothetical protein